MKLVYLATVTLLVVLASCSKNNTPTSADPANTGTINTHFYPTSSGTSALFVKDSLLYAGNTNGLIVYNINNIDSPQIVSTYPVTGGVKCFAIIGSRAYLGLINQNKIRELNIDSNQSMSFVKDVQMLEAPNAIDYADTILFVATASALTAYKTISLDSISSIALETAPSKIIVDQHRKAITLSCNRGFWNGNDDIWYDIYTFSYDSLPKIAMTARLDIGRSNYVYDLAWVDAINGICVSVSDYISFINVSLPTFPTLISTVKMSNSMGSPSVGIIKNYIVQTYRYGGVSICSYENYNSIRNVLTIASADAPEGKAIFTCRNSAFVACDSRIYVFTFPETDPRL